MQALLCEIKMNFFIKSNCFNEYLNIIINYFFLSGWESDEEIPKLNTQKPNKPDFMKKFKKEDLQPEI